MATEPVMLSPLPRKALEAFRSFPTSPVACSPSEELHTVRAFWFNEGDEEAAQELRAVLGYQTPAKVLPEWLPAFDARCLSEASTMVTSPPPPSSISPPTSPDPPPSVFSLPTSPGPPLSSASLPTSPDHTLLASPDLDDCIGSPTHDHQPRSSPGANDKSSWLQARKVFVGGIPQSMDQNSFYNTFSKIGKVKKAWLQLFHTEHRAGRVVTTRKHRGFGFVIFYEKHSVDRLLGAEFSRFVSLEGDMKFEVKRAVGKTSEQLSTKGGSSPLKAASSEQPALEGSKTPELAASPALPAPSGSQHCLPSSTLEPAAQQNWQTSPSQAFLVTLQPFNLPNVPQFPFAQAPTLQIPLVNAGPMPVPVQMLPSVTTVAPAPVINFMPVVRQKPFDPQELKQALLDAMPDHYDD